MNATFRKTRCVCGNDSYLRTWDFDQPGDGAPVWKCLNCSRLTPRRSHRRRTNAHRAHDLYLALRTEWQPVDEALRALVETGVASGCLMVFTSTFNYHLRTLAGDNGKITTTGIKVSEELAREDLAKAREFVKAYDTYWDSKKEEIHG